jgi:hypothetical protein
MAARAETIPMRLGIILCATLLAICTTGSARADTLARGDKNFWLGMTRAELDSAITARGVNVISDGTAFVACTSDENGVEYEQYAFIQSASGQEFLWRVTIGYRLEATPKNYLDARNQLITSLGTPKSDSWKQGDDGVNGDGTPVATSQKTVWVDRYTTVQIGGRWTNAPDRGPERMLVSWTDRRFQKVMNARHKKGTTGAGSGS